MMDDAFRTRSVSLISLSLIMVVIAAISAPAAAQWTIETVDEGIGQGFAISLLNRL